MELLNHLRVLRRRWLYLVLGLLVGAAAGYVTAPGEGQRPVRFEATATLIVNPEATNDDANENRSALLLQLQQGGLLATTGEVPERAAARLGESDAAALADQVEAVADEDTRSLRVTARAQTAERASDLVNTFSEELIAHLEEETAASYQVELDQAGVQVTTLFTQLSDLEAQVAATAEDDPRLGTLEAQRSTVAGRYQLALETLQQLQTRGAPPAPLKILERGVGEVAPDEGIRAPDGKPARAALLGAFGLLLGIGGALTSDRLDLRIKDEHDAEAYFGAPVIAEIPPLPGGRSNSTELFAITQPALPFVESYRALRTVVLFAAEGHTVDETADDGNVAAVRGTDEATGKVVLITSPSAGEGKSTTAAHLAVVLAESGKRVLLVGGDVRQPRVHELFDAPRDPGLTDVLAEDTDVRLSDIKLATSVERLMLLPSGPPVNNPAPLLKSAVQVLAAARRMFDFVIVDSPPLLVANDATELATVADHVILLARADRTTRDAARRATEVLERVDAPILGVVLIATHDTATAYSYYKGRYYNAVDEADDTPAPTEKHSRRERKARERDEPAHMTGRSESG